jgi:hypothetical protein
MTKSDCGIILRQYPENLLGGENCGKLFRICDLSTDIPTEYIMNKSTTF